jgi:hypothetical protein
MGSANAAPQQYRTAIALAPAATIVDAIRALLLKLRSSPFRSGRSLKASLRSESRVVGDAMYKVAQYVGPHFVVCYVT